MELSKKTTILMTPELHKLLVETSQRTGRSIGELVRSACEAKYGRSTIDQRLAAVERISKLNLPVADVATMKRESISEPKPLPGWSPE